MEKAVLEDVIQRLDRLEKMMTEVNQHLAVITEDIEPRSAERLRRVCKGKGS